MSKLMLVDKINHRFKQMTGNSNQASGLTVCLEHIKKSLKGVVRIEVDNVDHIAYGIQKFKPKIVLVQSIWMSEEQMNDLRRRYPKTRFYTHIHSSPAFFAVEGYGFQRIMEAHRAGFGIVTNSKGLHEIIKGSVLLPNLYASDMWDRLPKDNSTLDIACLGSLRPFKNQVIQAAAAIKYAESKGKKLRFYVNMGRNEGGAEIKMSLMGLFSLYKEGGHQLISVPWKTHEEVIQFLRTMDLGMQVSMTESFNLVAADYVAAGIPLIVSEQIDWVYWSCRAHLDDTASIVSTIERVLEHGDGLANLNRRLLGVHNEGARKAWEAFIDS